MAYRLLWIFCFFGLSCASPLDEISPSGALTESLPRALVRDAFVLEDVGVFQYKVLFSRPLFKDSFLTFKLGASGDTAAWSIDYGGGSFEEDYLLGKTVKVLSGSREFTLAVPIVNNEDLGNKHFTVRVTLNEENFNTYGNPELTSRVTILDEDASLGGVPEIFLIPPKTFENSNLVSEIFIYPEARRDFIYQVTLQIPDGKAQVKTVVVPALATRSRVEFELSDNNIYDGLDKALDLEFEFPSTLTSSRSQISVQILDDEQPPVLRFPSQVTLEEDRVLGGELVGTVYELPVELSHPTARDLRVDVNYGGDSSVVRSRIPQALTFPRGEVRPEEGKIKIEIPGDDTSEDNENFRLNFSSSSAFLKPLDYQVNFLILDNDKP